ncbi:MAG: hypothetical protein ACQCXQ_10290 [Verrucomicrobiales bacterium]|nr:hypothetical protein [Verrucomicrobiota bacterium JB025]
MDQKEASARSPFAGCVILIAALLVMVFLVVFSTLTLFRQFDEIVKFTGDEPVEIELAKTDGEEAAINELAAKLEVFRQQLADPAGEARLELDADEINLAIAIYEPFKELRGTLRISSIDEEAMRAAISYEMNGRPRLTRGDEEGLVASDSRYLNGTLVVKPALLKREVVLQIEDIEVDGAEVPEEFIGQMSPYRITERYLGHETIGPVMAELTRVGVSDGKLVLARVPGETPVDAISDAEVDAASGQFFTVLGIAACVFLLFAGTVIVVGLRAKRD